MYLEMGNTNTKKPANRQTRVRSQEGTDDVRYGSSDDIQVDSGNRFDEQVISTLKKDLSETPELFVLNNMLMCVMFFENYQKEVQELASKRYYKDEECIAPDLLLENVNKNVLYRPLHGPKKYNSETLAPKRLYVINDVVQVVTTFENDSSYAKKATVRLEDSSRKGYVKLREVEAPSTPMESDDIPIAKSEPTPSTSRSSTESDTYGYSTITEMKTPKPIDIIKGLRRQEGRPNLPLSCISYRKVKKILMESDLEDKEIVNITDEDLYDIVSYINSKGFMKFFQNNIFPNGIGTNLGLEESEIRLAKSIPGKIFSDFHEGDKHIPCEVIPALSVNWPHKQTLEFLMKAKKEPEPRKRYIFPTPRMISEITNLSCVLVPKGYVRKKGEHSDSDLEWEIQFPQAERYLETFMSHSQAKCYLFLLALHKTYIEPATFQLGLLTEHIRSFMLWECETNYSDWPEHRLGTKLVTLITSLNSHIAKIDLRDFFIKEKNVLDNIPKKYLRHAQKVLHEVLEAPVMSFIKSLRNLRYTRGKHFYHPFEFDKLYDILIKSGMESTNPQLTSDMYIPPNMKMIKRLDPGIQVKHVQEAQKRKKIMKKRQEENEKKNLKKELEERRGSVDSVDLKWMCDKRFDVYKTRTLLIFFINNFIEIAKKCSQISSHRQTLFYLKQARYLTRIMKDECPALEVEEKEFVKQIKVLEDECNMRAVKEDSPRVVQNGAVHFNSNVPNRQASNSTSDTCSSTERAPRANGVVKPRKSVMFVESH